MPLCFLSAHLAVCQNQQTVARTNSLIALFVLRKCLEIGGTIIVILENPNFFEVFVPGQVLIQKKKKNINTTEGNSLH